MNHDYLPTESAPTPATTEMRSPLANENLSALICFFRISGLPVSQYDPWWWRIYNTLVLLFLFAMLCGLVFSIFYHGLNDEPFSVGAILFLCANGFFSYVTISYSVYSGGHNLIHVLQAMSASEINVYGRIHDLRHTSHTNNILLKLFCLKWFCISLCIGVISFALLFVAYGRHADGHFLDLGSNYGWRAVNLAYLYINIGWLLPMVLIRVGSHFLEQRILRLIEYLEYKNNEWNQRVDSESTVSQILENIFQSSNHQLATIDDVRLTGDLTSMEMDVSIGQVMSWYDDIYALNQTLSNAFSLIIFQSILLLFPVAIFILIVCQSPPPPTLSLILLSSSGLPPKISLPF
jgi:hypothetical protein